MPVIAVTVAPAIAPSKRRPRRIFSKSMSTLSGSLADDEALQGMDHLRAAFAAVDALAVADDPFVRVDPDVGRIAMALDLGGADVGDLHAFPVSRSNSISFSGDGG